MTQNEINILLSKQKEFFHTGKTKKLSFRIENLKKLYNLILGNEELILEALYKDLHKSKTEAYTSEIAYILNEITFVIKNLKSWSKAKKVSTSIINQPAKSYIVSEPYGICLIIGPWNYPLGLLFTPLIAAIAAGNCAIIKPSEISKNSANLIENLINKNFSESYIRVVQGNAAITQSMINEHIDYIFFTGSTQVGKKIMRAAANHLIPVTLELGGKNPCIVDKEVNLEIAAKRIIWGKFFNAGQTCIAPDYLLVHSDIIEPFLKVLAETVKNFYPNIDSNSPNYAHIINLAHFHRLRNLMNAGKIYSGGKYDEQNLFIEPTLITDVDFSSKIMQEEIFGPLLPIIEYKNLEAVIIKLRELPKPLSLHFLSENKQNQEKIINETSSGSITINGTIHNIMSSTLPFGGVGLSGIGKYHGKASFDTFSHQKSILVKSFKFDFSVIYPPYKTQLNVLKQFVKRLY